ncbi:MAG: hypothetical protein R3E86_08900 [Pseudomonadales bacterium]
MLKIPMMPAVAIAFSIAMPIAAIEHPTPAIEQGTFKPSGPPDHPSRYEIGDICIVDLEQSYDVEGTLAGSMTIDFRIFVEGPCGAPPGTYEEHWIAHGHYHFENSRQTSGQGSLAYVAVVSAGGEVSGDLTFAGELEGDLKIDGRFQDGAMHYEGSIESNVKE